MLTVLWWSIFLLIQKVFKEIIYLRKDVWSKSGVREIYITTQIFWKISTKYSSISTKCWLLEASKIKVTKVPVKVSICRYGKPDLWPSHTWSWGRGTASCCSPSHPAVWRSIWGGSATWVGPGCSPIWSGCWWRPPVVNTGEGIKTSQTIRLDNLKTYCLKKEWDAKKEEDDRCTVNKTEVTPPLLLFQGTCLQPLERCLPAGRWDKVSRFFYDSSSGRHRSSLGGCSFCKKNCHESVCTVEFVFHGGLSVSLVFLSADKQLTGFQNDKCDIMIRKNSLLWQNVNLMTNKLLRTCPSLATALVSENKFVINNYKVVSPDEVECRESDVVFDEHCEVLSSCQQSRPASWKNLTIILIIRYISITETD